MTTLFIGHFESQEDTSEFIVITEDRESLRDHVYGDYRIINIYELDSYSSFINIPMDRPLREER